MWRTEQLPTLVAVVQTGDTLAPATLCELRDAALADDRRDKLRASPKRSALA